MNFKQIWLLSLSLMAGVILATMIFLNGILAKYSNPLWASLIAHAIGSIAALIAFFIFEFKSIRKSHKTTTRLPFWIYLSGIPGALNVVIAGYTVNSALALSGSLALMLLGQVAFSLLIDTTGIFGFKIRKIKLPEIFEVLSILVGSGILIFFAR
jgi:transporter family-2 protein